MNSFDKNSIKEKLENIDIMNKFDIKYISYEKNDTILLGFLFAKLAKKGSVFVLNGELGSGKTIFMNGFCDFFGIKDQVSSPTFTIVNEYNSKNTDDIIYHFDVYRIKSEDEFEADIGLDYFQNGICVIEWGNIIKNLLPRKTIYFDITKDDKNENTRYFHIYMK